MQNHNVRNSEKDVFNWGLAYIFSRLVHIHDGEIIGGRGKLGTGAVTENICCRQTEGLGLV